MMDQMSLFHSILWCFGFLMISVACIAINLPKPNRGRQFLLPIVAVIFSIVAMVGIEEISEEVQGVIEQSPLILLLIGNVEIGAALIYVVNIAIVGAFFLTKAVLLPVVNLIWRKEAVMELTSGYFYDHIVISSAKPAKNSDASDEDEGEDEEDKVESSDQEDEDQNVEAKSSKEDADKNSSKKDEPDEEWIVKKEFLQFKTYYWGFYAALLVVITTIFLLSQYFPDWEVFEAIFYPAFAVLILGEVACYLSGKEERTPLPPAPEKVKKPEPVPEYDFLRKIMRDLFGDRDLHDCVLMPEAITSDEQRHLDRLSASPDETDKLVSAYFERLQQEGIGLDENGIDMTTWLMHGHSVLVCNPFYKDLTHYLLMPMIHHLMDFHKCLVVVGRDSAVDDVKAWLERGILDFSGTNSLWHTEVVSKLACEADVGVLRACDLYNQEIIDNNRAFWSQVGFVFIVEPSRILATAQMGLSILISHCERADKEIVYCACDRNCDGLVDSLSHVLRTSLTEVSATPLGNACSSQMFWQANGAFIQHRIFPAISRYLGMGTEFGALALKHHITPTTWLSCDKFPVVDMKWVSGQYYRQICQFTALPVSQAEFNAAFLVQPNLWHEEKRENAYLTVEDEFQNLFEVSRIFMSRATKQSFINVISENYFLRDYMVANVQTFMGDMKALPTIVPDFARTERNVVLKLVMMMLNGVVRDDIIEREFRLCGIAYHDIYTKLVELIAKHCGVEDPRLSVHFDEEVVENALESRQIRSYDIKDNVALSAYARTLQTAYFVAEDEVDASHHLGAKLYGHVFQTVLPGQYITFEGKYYEVLRVTPESSIVVRRAADHLSDRVYYRQLRKIHLHRWVADEAMGANRVFSQIGLTRGFVDFDVSTLGYLELSSYEDLKTARRVVVSGIPSRSYVNKSALRVRLPGVSRETLFTICLLLNEIFRTTYPDSNQFVAAVLPTEAYADSALSEAVYGFEGECEPDCFYILEDSVIDLGLVVSVERNLKRYFEIITEVLAWHLEKLVEVPEPTDSDEEAKAHDAAKDELVETAEVAPVKEKMGLFARIIAWFKNLFVGGDLKNVADELPDETQNKDTAKKAEEKPVLKPLPYAERCFLKYGFEAFDPMLDVEQTLAYLCQFGFEHNALASVREAAQSRQKEAGRTAE